MKDAPEGKRKGNKAREHALRERTGALDPGEGGSREGRGREEKKREQSEQVERIFFSFFILFSPLSLRAFLFSALSLSLSLVSHAFPSPDAEARSRCSRDGVGVASLACDSPATNDNDAAPTKLAISPVDVATTFSASPPCLLLCLLVLLLLGVHLGLRSRPEGVRSDDARLCRREQIGG